MSASFSRDGERDVLRIDSRYYVHGAEQEEIEVVFGVGGGWLGTLFDRCLGVKEWREIPVFDVSVVREESVWKDAKTIFKKGKVTSHTEESVKIPRTSPPRASLPMPMLEAFFFGFGLTK